MKSEGDNRKGSSRPCAAPACLGKNSCSCERGFPPKSMAADYSSAESVLSFTS